MAGEPAISVAAAARRLGIAPATLRTWDRRYGLGPSDHQPGGHRRYSPTDVEQLGAVRALINRGVTVADAARHVLSSGASGSSQPVDAEAVPGGGRTLRLRDSTPLTRGLGKAALALDGPGSTKILAAAVQEYGVESTWNQVIVPVLESVGLRWEKTGEGIEVEHLLSASVIAAMNVVADGLSEARNPRPVLLACAETELHSLPLYAIGAGLAQRGIAARILGQRVPALALQAAISRLGPAAVLVWSCLPRSGDPAELDALPRLRPTPLVVAAGPGWLGELPDGVDSVATLGDALDRLEAAAA